MKKLAFALIVAGLAAVSSCSDDQYNHSFVVVRPLSSQAIAYADATVDTIRVNTTDAYTVRSTAPWMAIAAGSEANNLKYMYGGIYVNEPIALTLEANTTGKTRQGYVEIQTKGDDGWAQTVNVMLTQYGWLNVLRPAARYTTADAATATALFERTDSAATTLDSIAFNVSGDWTLTASQPSNVHPATTSGPKGRHTVRLTLDANTSQTDTLHSVLTLMSRGVATAITIHQLPVRR